MGLAKTHYHIVKTFNSIHKVDAYIGTEAIKQFAEGFFGWQDKAMHLKFCQLLVT